MKTFWRQIKREFFCVDRTMLAVFAGAAVLFGIFFALGGVSRYVVGHLIFPRGALPSLVMVLLWSVMLAALGVSAALVRSSDTAPVFVPKNMLFLLFLAALMLCYVWIPLVYKAASFFAALLVLAVLLLCLLAIFCGVRRSCAAVTVILAIFALWVGYLFYYTLALLLLN